MDMPVLGFFCSYARAINSVKANGIPFGSLTVGRHII